MRIFDNQLTRFLTLHSPCALDKKNRSMNRRQETKVSRWERKLEHTLHRNGGKIEKEVTIGHNTYDVTATASPGKVLAVTVKPRRGKGTILYSYPDTIQPPGVNSRVMMVVEPNGSTSDIETDLYKREEVGRITRQLALNTEA